MMARYKCDNDDNDDDDDGDDDDGDGDNYGSSIHSGS